MKSRGLLLLAALATLACFAHGNEADRLFYEAVRVEAKGELEDAIASYENAIAHAHSANLHGNLANLYFKMGNHGKAILHYYKALLLDSNNLELKANLAQVRNIAGLPSPKPSADDTYFAPTTTDAWCWTTMILFWIGLMSGLFFLRALLPNSAKIAVAASWAALVLFGAYASWRADRNIALLTRDAVAVAATGMASSQEGRLFRVTLRHSIILALFMGVVTMIFAYLLPQFVPQV